MDDLQFALNTRKHESTGFTPAFLNFGRELELIQTLNKDLINIEEIESQEIGKWVERPNRLKIIKHEVQKHLEVENEKHKKQVRQVTSQLGHERYKEKYIVKAK